MTPIDELLQEVRRVGATLRAEPPDLVIGNPGLVPVELEARLRERKAELLAALQGEAELVASRKRLEAAHISIAIEADGSIRLIHDHHAKTAAKAGATVYTPGEMLLYVTLTETERRLIRELKGLRP